MATATQPAQNPSASIDAMIQTAKDVQSFRASLVDTAATMLGVQPEKLCGLLRNVWQTSKGQDPLTDREMFQGISMIARYWLDPISKEIYVTRTSKGLVTIIAIDGWVKILDRTDHYDGFEQDLVEDSEGNVTQIKTCIYSKKRSHPTTYIARASEYQKICGPVAKTIPTHMLGLFSLRHAARLFTPIGGNVMTEEEAASLMRHDNVPQSAQQPGASAPSTLDDLAAHLDDSTDDSPPQADEPAAETAEQDAPGVEIEWDYESAVYEIDMADSPEGVNEIIRKAMRSSSLKDEDKAALQKVSIKRLEFLEKSQDADNPSE